MAVTTQQANVETMATLTGLTHDIFVGKVVDNVRFSSEVSKLFKDLPRDGYSLEGQNMVFAVDLRFKTGAMATDGNIPDYVGLDPVQGKIAPVRRYARIALDNMVEQRATGRGAFEPLEDRIFDKVWDSWEHMEIRQAIGSSSALLGVVESRTSSTVFVIKDAYGMVGSNPIPNIAEGSILAWWDLTATAAIDGAAKVSSIAYDTRTITMDSAATWEPADVLAAGDLIYFATTNNITNNHFVAERNLAPNGIGTIVDPAALATTVFNISETTYQRWKPYRVASTTFDHLEVAEHWLQLGSKRGFDVSPQTDAFITYPSNVAQLARSLMGFQQQAYTGGDINGGYQQVHISGMPILQDGHFYQDVAVTLHKDSLYRINLGRDADFWDGDGSMWARIPNFDGKDAFVVDYMNYLCTDRGANGALTGIVTPDITDSAFLPAPNY